MGVLDNLTTQQKVILGLGGGAVGLFMLTGFGKKRQSAAGGALAVVDVRRPTDDINAPAGVGANRGGGNWQQVLNVNPLWGQDPMGWDRPGPKPPGAAEPPPPGPPPATVPTTSTLTRLQARFREQAADRANMRMSGKFVNRVEAETRRVDYRDPKAREGSRPVMPQGPPVEDTPMARQPQRGIHGSIVNGQLQMLQQGNLPIFGSIINQR